MFEDIYGDCVYMSGEPIHRAVKQHTCTYTRPQNIVSSSAGTVFRGLGIKNCPAPPVIMTHGSNFNGQ